MEQSKFIWGLPRNTHIGGTSETPSMQVSPVGTGHTWSAAEEIIHVHNINPTYNSGLSIQHSTVTPETAAPPGSQCLHTSVCNLPRLALSAHQSPTRSSQGPPARVPNDQADRHRQHKKTLPSGNRQMDQPKPPPNGYPHKDICRNLTAALNHAAGENTSQLPEYIRVPSQPAMYAGGSHLAAAQSLQDISHSYSRQQCLSTHNSVSAKHLTHSTILSSASASLLCTPSDHRSSFQVCQNGPSRSFAHQFEHGSDKGQFITGPAQIAPSSGVCSSMESMSSCNSIDDDIVGIARQQGASLVDMCERMVGSWKARAMQAETAKQAAQVQVWVHESRARGLKQQLDILQQDLGMARQAEDEAIHALSSVQGEKFGFHSGSICAVKLDCSTLRRMPVSGHVQAKQS